MGVVSEPEQPQQTQTQTQSSSTGTSSSNVVENNTNPEYLYEERSKPCFLWTLLLAPCLMPIVWEYNVTITINELQFGYSCGCMRKIVNRSDIVSVEIIDHINGFMDWGGYGIRKQLPSWDTGYIARNGPGLKIIIKQQQSQSNSTTTAPTDTKELCYTFSCHNPNDVATILTA